MKGILNVSRALFMVVIIVLFFIGCTDYQSKLPAMEDSTSIDGNNVPQDVHLAPPGRGSNTAIYRGG